MNRNKLTVLLLTTLIVIVAAVAFSNIKAPKTAKTKELLFPELSAKLNDIARIEVQGFENKIVIVNKDNFWLLESSDLYPAIFAKVNTMLVQFANFKVLAGKTKNPDLYYRLAVEGPVNKGTKSLLVKLFDGTGQELSSLIIGKPKKTSAANPIPAMYVRLPDNKQSLLVEGQLDISLETKDWFERDILDISAERISEVIIRPENGDEVTLYRENVGEPNFTLKNIPEGKKPTTQILLNRPGTLLETIRANEVKSVNNPTMAHPTVTTTFKTFDGLAVTAKLLEFEGEGYANFHFASETNDTNADDKDNADQPSADELNATLSPWYYQIPRFKFDDMTKQLADFLSN